LADSDTAIANKRECSFRVSVTFSPTSTPSAPSGVAGVTPLYENVRPEVAREIAKLALGEIADRREVGGLDGQGERDDCEERRVS
jgi:hypothetical protein